MASPLRFSALLFLLATTACSERAQPQSTELRDRILEAIGRGEGTIIDFGILVPGDWDRFHVFPPYVQVEHIDAQLGFPWPTAEATGIHMLDHFTLVVFVADAEVTHWIGIPRASGDFPPQFTTGAQPRSSRFTVQRGKDRSWLLLPAGS